MAETSVQSLIEALARVEARLTALEQRQAMILEELRNNHRLIADARVHQIESHQGSVEGY